MTIRSQPSWSADNVSATDQSVAQSHLPFIINFVRKKLEDEIGDNEVVSSSVNVTSIPSAQHSVFLLRFNNPPTYATSSSVCSLPSCQKSFSNALYNGNGRFVLRIWKNGCRWWNLNTNVLLALQVDDKHGTKSTALLARAEVIGYRIAQRIFSTSEFIQPDVLFFSHDDENTQFQRDTESLSYPWALFSYVGEESRYYCESKKNVDNYQSHSTWVFDSSLIRNMIRTRLEYDFIEAHPRHGRIPVDQSLDYALHLLNTFILPLHSILFSTEQKPEASVLYSMQELDSLRIYGFNNETTNADTVHRISQPVRYGDMVSIYVKALEIIHESISQPNKDNVITHDTKFIQVLHDLEPCIRMLRQDERSMISRGEYNSLPGVLCHMDLQPQNILFHRQMYHDAVKHFDTLPMISSVLDWEECCYADPRFEILLICRKVLANREQANILWEYYSTKLGEMRFNVLVGPIEPWLRLESVHSILSMILHLCLYPSSRSSGRNPWETENELWSKIERERKRLGVLAQEETLTVHDNL